ncbi:DnaJ domain protein [Necator americanus]|uniref:DnaJ domain protein n=1 Tax=Necator americanus TaxID=51031 RepID=W2TSI5_NECAM|nr:DnaJ domain protein [Necator americanus]ETN83987.1 DnaJ domain protein [Necator americanus]
MDPSELSGLGRRKEKHFLALLSTCSSCPKPTNRFVERSAMLHVLSFEFLFAFLQSSLFFSFSCDILDARRMAHASVVDDPEKHFLGNLLEEDTSQNPLPLTAGSSPSLGTIPPVSVISGVGPISSTNSLLRSYWPEPPPPYSPPTQVESHHHYPITTITVPSHSYCPNFLTEDPPNIGNFILNDECRRFSSDSSMKYATQKMGEDELPLPSITLLPNKLPLSTASIFSSYRDVAARNDQITGSDGSPLPQVKKLQSHPGSENSSNFLKVQENVDGESATIVKTKGSRKSKSDQPVEFQKITRKKVATKKDKASLRAFSSLHVVDQTAIVDVPTKYEILQKLLLKSSKGTLSTGDVLMSRREQENMRPTMMNGRPRSSSLFPVIVIVFLFGWIELGFKWILNLVVDVCLQIYAVTFFSIIYLWGSVHSHIRRFFIMTSSAALYSVASIRQIDLRRLLRFREPEPLVWGLEENIVLPTTGEEALERFLYSPKCQDAYGVLGLQASCTEEDVRRHYKKLSTLLNPERNPLEGAEEAYEMVTKAYQVLSTPESRKAYNFYRIRPCKSDLHHEIGEMWDRVRERIKDSRSSMYCDCGHRHARIALDIPQCEARYCRRCKTRHPARANDIWVETRLCGFLWVYFTCCDGVIYDITDWATCEANYLKHVRPNSHAVQYRLVSPSRRPTCDDPSSHYHHNDKVRELADVANEIRPDWGRPGHAQISYLPLEPRDEDRSRRAANRRQKKWR